MFIFELLISLIIELIGQVFVGLIFHPFTTESKGRLNLQQIKDGLFDNGATHVMIKYLQYQRWGRRTYMISFKNQDGVECEAEFMIPKHNINSIVWTAQPKEIL